MIPTMMLKAQSPMKAPAPAPPPPPVEPAAKIAASATMSNVPFDRVLIRLRGSRSYRGFALLQRPGLAGWVGIPTAERLGARRSAGAPYLDRCGSGFALPARTTR